MPFQTSVKESLKVSPLKRNRFRNHMSKNWQKNRFLAIPILGIVVNLVPGSVQNNSTCHVSNCSKLSSLYCHNSYRRMESCIRRHSQRAHHGRGSDRARGVPDAARHSREPSDAKKVGSQSHDHIVFQTQIIMVSNQVFFFSSTSSSFPSSLSVVPPSNFDSRALLLARESLSAVYLVTVFSTKTDRQSKLFFCTFPPWPTKSQCLVRFF